NNYILQCGSNSTQFFFSNSSNQRSFCFLILYIYQYDQEIDYNHHQIQILTELLIFRIIYKSNI
ncbi:hypothetical protein pb186bvf_019969, partial [Paramecium bursaria]